MVDHMEAVYITRGFYQEKSLLNITVQVKLLSLLNSSLLWLNMSERLSKGSEKSSFVVYLFPLLHSCEYNFFYIAL